MLGLINPVIIFAIVDLPEPDSPTNPSVSPSNNSKDTLSTALTILSFELLLEINEKPLPKELSSKTFVTSSSFNNF